LRDCGESHREPGIAPESAGRSASGRATAALLSRMQERGESPVPAALKSMGGRAGAGRVAHDVTTVTAQ
jgi:hypothetical protein